MAPTPIKLVADAIDLSPRVKASTAVAASPALAAETTIATLTIGNDEASTSGVLLVGWAAFLVGASGTAATFKLRRTGTAGTTVATSGALNVTAADLRAVSIVGFDTGPTLPGQVYVLTLTVTAGAAESTVSAVALAAVVV